MLVHPQFDPIAIHLGPLAIRWYGLMYLIGFASFILLGRYRIKHNPQGVFTRAMLDDMLLYGVLGVILGGRLGHVLFYQFGYYYSIRWRSLRFGRAECPFTGGFLVVISAMALLARKSEKIAVAGHNGFHCAAGTVGFGRRPDEVIS